MLVGISPMHCRLKGGGFGLRFGCKDQSTYGPLLQVGIRWDVVAVWQVRCSVRWKPEKQPTKSTPRRQLRGLPKLAQTRCHALPPSGSQVGPRGCRWGWGMATPPWATQDSALCAGVATDRRVRRVVAEFGGEAQPIIPSSALDFA